MSPRIKNLVILAVVLLAAAFGINKGCSKETQTTPMDIDSIRSQQGEMMMKHLPGGGGAPKQADQ